MEREGSVAGLTHTYAFISSYKVGFRAENAFQNQNTAYHFVNLCIHLCLLELLPHFIDIKIIPNNLLLMKVLYTKPEVETTYVFIEDGLCQSREIRYVGGEDRDGWNVDK